MKLLINYFLRGLLIVFPVGATIYLALISVNWLNTTFNNLFFTWLDFQVPGLGIITGLVIITVTGYLFSRAFLKPIFNAFENLLSHTPFLNLVYTSLKDLTEAFVGEKKKFNKPVLIPFGGEGVKRMGFITQEDIPFLNSSTQVAVYCPHSYNFSGNVYLVPGDVVEPITVDATEYMRFIVSGGVTELKEKPRKIS
ncbi:MAG: DUF502 domain-containing protein [Bacteroidota bacterium]